MSSGGELLEKIKTKKITAGIIGMGYVGSYLAGLLQVKHVTTIGFDIDSKKVESINKKEEEYLSATTDMSSLQECDVILICVQTPVDENKQPDLKYLISAVKETSGVLRSGQLVVIESSVATGTTRNVVLPILEKSGFAVERDFFLAFSPERVDPGNKKFALEEIPKVVAGIGEKSGEVALKFYETIMKKAVKVSSPETAEMVKLFENSFRLVNISLVNELCEYAKKRGIDMWEVVDAASTKPFGFLAHYPSPGVGGHCIPVDPFYLFDDAKKHGVYLSMIEAAGRINDEQPKKVVGRAIELLDQKITLRADVQRDFVRAYQFKTFNNNGQQIESMSGQKGGIVSIDGVAEKPKILIVGIAYKPDINDVRESAALRIWSLLEEMGCTISYHDPYVPAFKDKTSEPLTDGVVSTCDMIVIATNHSSIDYERLASFGTPVLDTRHVYSNGMGKPHIYSL